MKFPLYEYDQVITLEDLISIARAVSQDLDTTPRWRFIRRATFRIQFDVVVGLINGLRAKPGIVSSLRELNQGENV